MKSLGGKKEHHVLAKAEQTWNFDVRWDLALTVDVTWVLASWAFIILIKYINRLDNTSLYYPSVGQGKRQTEKTELPPFTKV